MTRRGTRALTLAMLGAVAVSMTACGDDKKDSSSDKPAGPAKLAISAADGAQKEATFTVPATATGGLVTMTFTNGSAAPRGAQLVKVDAGHSVDEVLKAVSVDGGPTPEWLRGAGGVGTTNPGASATAQLALPAGDYVVFDTGDQDAKTKAGGTAFKVQGGDAAAKVAPTSATITASEPTEDRYKLEASGLKAGANQLTFENKGDELHHVILFPVAKGFTPDKAIAAFLAGDKYKGPPPADFENAQDVAVLDKDQSEVVPVTLPAGDYIMACFISDRKGGPPHAFKKHMISSVTVT